MADHCGDFLFGFDSCRTITPAGSDEGDLTGSGKFTDPIGANHVDEGLDLLLMTRNLDHELLGSDIYNPASEDLNQPMNLSTHRRWSINFDEHKITFDVIFSRDIKHLDDGDYLLELLADLFENPVIPHHHNRDPGEVRILGLANRQAIDIETTRGKHTRDMRKHAGLVLDQSREHVPVASRRMCHVRNRVGHRHRTKSPQRQTNPRAGRGQESSLVTHASHDKATQCRDTPEPSLVHVSNEPLDLWSPNDYICKRHIARPLLDQNQGSRTAMNGHELARTRRRVGWVMTVGFSAWVVWILTPGIPVLWGPRASAKVKADGLTLFAHEWQPHDPLAKGDGLGPVFNGRSCVVCHFQGGTGGGGGNKQNVKTFEAVPTKDDPEVRTGLVHAFAVTNHFMEGQEALRQLFPVIVGGELVESGCSILRRDFDRVRTESINSTALFGAGWIDRLPSKTIDHESFKASMSRIGRELSADFGGIIPGRPRILPDGRVGKFGWKAQFATLEEFVAAACANEIGLGNPLMAQAKPLTKVNYPDVPPDLDRGQFRSLVAFVDTLPRPQEVTPETEAEAQRTASGKALFKKIGCAVCHTPDLGGVEGIYSDFLLHRLDDQKNGGSGYGPKQTPAVPLPHEYPRPEEWKTPPLWGVADSAPYFHDGASPTLDAAILRHHGNAEVVNEAYRGLGRPDREALVGFLKTLKAPSEAVPASTPSSTMASNK